MMDTLQIRTLEHVLELLQAVDTYKIYTTVDSAIEPIDDMLLKRNIMFLCKRAIDAEDYKIKEAMSWIKALIEKK